MSPKKKQRKNKDADKDKDPVEINNADICNSSSNILYTSENLDHYNIIQNQDEEYEISIIMDIIKMQEKEELERLEREKREEIERQNILNEKILQRDHNIKEILRKMKFQVSNLSSFEIDLINILENMMNTKELIIILDNKVFYNKILDYLGLTDKKPSIRLSDDVKYFVKNTFQLEM